MQAESLAAAARLAIATGEERCWTWQDRTWSNALTHFVDHQYGGCYHIVDRDNRKYSDEKSPAGRTDYHIMGACHDVLSVLRARP